MRRVHPLTIGTLLAVGAAIILLAAANAAMVRVGTLVLRTDGGFQPLALAQRTYTPISFWGHAEISTTNSAPPPALQHAVIDFDRDGRLTTSGLAVCQPTQIEGTTPSQARQSCRSAIVGTGHVTATITLPGSSPVDVRSPLTLFNGPRQNGNPTVLAHARTTFPAAETYVVSVPIETRHGAYSYRVTFNVPEIANGYGALTHVDLKIGRRYRSGGAIRSYTSARCSDGVLETRGRFSFADGVIISGTVFKPCQIRRP